MDFTDKIFELIKKTATTLPDDVVSALEKIRQDENPDGNAADVMSTISDNIQIAKNLCQPVCQDTGMLSFYIENAPEDVNRSDFEKSAVEAVRYATACGLLRPNCVDSLTGKNTGDNTGISFPAFHWDYRDSMEKTDSFQVTLMLKGGGSENMSRQYSLPDQEIHAGRDLDGVRKCLLHGINQIQGCGCAPGILGVCIGGDRASGYAAAKEQLLRRIGQKNKNPELEALEKIVLEQANSLGIGPMGLGGKHTLMDVFITALPRHPATYYVSIAYMCWCCRRQKLVLKM